MKCECNTTLCPEHRQSFLDILGDVPDRLATMNVSIRKQSVMGGQGGSPTNDDDRPLPINFGAAEAQRALVVTLVDTCKRVRYCLPEGKAPYPTLRGAAEWMAGRMPAIVQRPESVHWYHDIRNAYDKAGQAIDLPAERVRAGRCWDCNQVLYATVGNEKVRCRPCLRSYDVAALQSQEIALVRAYTGTAAEVLRVLEHAGVRIKLKRLTSWADRGQVIYSTVDGIKRYTVGDVHDLYNQMEGIK